MFRSKIADWQEAYMEKLNREYCEEYYPPVMEDYSGNGEYALEECCKKLGLKIISFECDGSMSDFEPDHMRW